MLLVCIYAVFIQCIAMATSANGRTPSFGKVLNYSTVLIRALGMVARYFGKSRRATR